MKVVKSLTVISAVLMFNVFFTGNVLGQEPNNTKPGEKPNSETVNKVGSVNSESQMTAQKQTNEKYRIGFQDTLEVQVFRHPELSTGAVNVSPDGTILLPRIEKPIVVVCKTERELGDIIGTLYKGYLKNPFVTVRAVQQLSQPFAVIGAVEKPGNFYLNRKIRLLELLTFAGGPKVEKAGGKIQVARTGNPAGCAENVEDADNQVVFLPFKTNDVMAGRDNPWMQPGDIVSVLEAEEAYVVGNVNKPTTVSLKEQVTLTQAIAIAQGFDDTAKLDKIVIQRQASGTQPKTELVYNYKDIREKKIPDPLLQANDIVEISTDRNKTLKKGIFDLLKSVAPGAIYRF